MEFPIESCIVRKKRTMGRRKPKSLFNKIPFELQLKVFEKLCARDQSRAMCVSHAWRDLMLYNTLPNKGSAQSLVNSRLFPISIIVEILGQQFIWYSEVMHCVVKPKHLMDACNGLLLFCHNVGQAQNITYGAYHYYVMNHATKQCLAVLKPKGQFTGGYSYATLAYDPAESWFFKIVRFQGCIHINVFSSETGVWTTLTLGLPDIVTIFGWIKKSLYFKKSIYRLSNSGHLIKIKVDPQENPSEQAEAMDLPPDSLFEDCHWDLTLNGDKLFFVMSRGVNLMIFELVEVITRGVTTYSWSNIQNINDQILRDFNTYGKLLCYYPDHDLVVFKVDNSIFYYSHMSTIKVQRVPYNEILYDYLIHCRPSFLECLASFACVLEKKHPTDFQWLPMPQ